MVTSLPPQIYQNSILGSLDPDCIERLRLKSITLESEQRLADPDDPVRWLLFIESGSVAHSVPLKNGNIIETGIFGHTSVIFAMALLGPRESLHQVTVRSPGHGFVCPIDNALQEFARFGQFHDRTLACLPHQFFQASQIAACNCRHDVQQRLCRWLLHCLDESAALNVFATQESLAEALGIRRTTVTLAMHTLKTQGAIAYGRGRIRVTDRTALEALSCECYEALRKSSGAAAVVHSFAEKALQGTTAVEQGIRQLSSQDRRADPAGRRPAYHVQ